jgi:hypothetical protein
MTFPPEPVNGSMVSGLGTPDFKPFTQPEELGARLLQGGYRVNRESGTSLDGVVGQQLVGSRLHLLESEAPI